MVLNEFKNPKKFLAYFLFLLFSIILNQQKITELSETLGGIPWTEFAWIVTLIVIIMYIPIFWLKMIDKILEGSREYGKTGQLPKFLVV